MIAVSVLIVSCPCALALALPLSLGLALSRSKELGFYLRNSDIFLKLKQIKTIFFDKTGTLTYSQRKVTQWNWMDLDIKHRKDLLPRIKKLCRQSIHPTAQAILRSLEDLEVSEEQFTGFKETTHVGISGHFVTSAQNLCICKYLDPGNKESENLIHDLNLTDTPAFREYSGKHPDSCLFVNGKLAAALYLSEEIKPSVPALLSWLKRQGLQSILLSGDHTEKVQQFAEKTGFAQWHAEQSPEQKLEQLKQVQQSPGASLAIGDGFNDALLLGASDISVVVNNGTGSLTEQADILFTHNNFLHIRNLLELADSLPRATRTCYLISIIYNTIAVSLAVTGMVAPLTAAILMPLSSISVGITAWLSVARKPAGTG
jgi:cation transport ATPase